MGRKRIYAWHEIFRPVGGEGFTITFVRGEDYHCSTESMVQQIRNQASAHNATVKITHTDERITVYVQPR